MTIDKEELEEQAMKQATKELNERKLLKQENKI